MDSFRTALLLGEEFGAVYLTVPNSLVEGEYKTSNQLKREG